MPLVQLSRLRSQLNALAAHFKDPNVFRDSLTSLFLMYENKESTTNIWLRKSSQFSSYNVPESVMTELVSKIADLSRVMPEQVLVNADNLWEMPYYESRKVAIALVSNLEDTYQNDFLRRVHSWLSVDLEEVLIKDLLAAVEAKPAILQNKQWLDLIKTWLDSKDTNIIKLGLQALNRTLSHKYQNLPAIFSLLTPLVRNPQLVVQKELMGVIQALMVLSEAETASFLMMVGQLYPNDDVFMFLRKCLPLFDNYFQNELRSILNAR
ncbi:MAG: DNA alkylation repair protein [Pelolinea sp.]|nr:DNA alkylation repair protein [Pelolinea sp.]